MVPEEKAVPTKNDLKSLVRKQFERISKAATNSGEISDDDLLKLKRLADLQAALPEPPAHPGRRWPVILFSLGIFLIPGIMISLRVPSVEVQFNLLVSELSWQQAQQGEIMGYAELESLGISSFDSIKLPRVRQHDAGELTLPPGNFWIPVEGNGSISLAPVHADSDTKIWLSKEPAKSAAALSMQGIQTSITANVSGLVGIDAGGERLGERDFGRPKPVDIQATEPGLLDVTLQFKGDQGISFPSHIMISSLSLQELEDVVSDGLRTPRKVSTVLKGEIFNDSMNGKNYQLRKGEWLLVDGVVGEIRSMQMTADGIQLDYHGRVSSMSVGSSQNRRNLMPNWLEWFGERHSVKMLWGAFLWLLSTLFGVVKWWRRAQ